MTRVTMRGHVLDRSAAGPQQRPRIRERRGAGEPQAAAEPRRDVQRPARGAHVPGVAVAVSLLPHDQLAAVSDVRDGGLRRDERALRVRLSGVRKAGVEWPRECDADGALWP